MKNYIYSIFTAKNKIRMSKDTLEYIESICAREEDANALLELYKENCSNHIISIEEIKQIKEKGRDVAKPRYTVKEKRYTPQDYIARYEKYKEDLKYPIAAIVSLEEDAQENIFGILYRNKLNRFILEDPLGEIEIDISGCKEDAFLFENMFVGFRGCKRNGFFMVEQILLMDKHHHRKNNNSDKDDGGFKIGIAGCLFKNRVILKNSKISHYLEENKLDLLIISVCPSDQNENNILLENTSIEQKIAQERLEGKVVLMPCRCHRQLLPHKMQKRGSQENTQETMTSNPFTLEVGGKNIAIIDANIFDYRKSGIFLGENPLECFVRSYLSQDEFDPFGEIRMEMHADIVVVLQDYINVIMEVDGIWFVSLGNKQEPGLVEIEGSNVKIKIEANGANS
ncbi:hypothetical protein ENBRE01_1778 [Enteropsectra breve]|nr:hypothetical protein ENBRE01_1778 [Enteropsectra breve]